MCVLLSSHITTNINRRKAYRKRVQGSSPFLQGKGIVPNMLFWKAKKIFALHPWVCSSPLHPHHIQALPQLSPDLCSFLKYLFCSCKCNYKLLPFPEPSMCSGSKYNLSPKVQTDRIPQFPSLSLVGLLSWHSSLTLCVARKVSWSFNVTSSRDRVSNSVSRGLQRSGGNRMHTGLKGNKQH